MGIFIKNMVNEMNLQIMNCVWERIHLLNVPTWFSDNSEFPWIIYVLMIVH